MEFADSVVNRAKADPNKDREQLDSQRVLIGCFSTLQNEFIDMLDCRNILLP